MKTSLPSLPLGIPPRVFAYLLGAGILVYFALLAIASPLGSRWLDFPVYWEAGRKALDGATVYDVAGHFQYKYSPLVALLFGKIFQATSFTTASWIFQKAMLLLWARMIWQVSHGRIGVIVLFILFFGNALRLDLALGQLNALVFYFLLLLFALLEKERTLSRDLGFGFLFSFAVQLKLFSLVLLPLLIFRREWRKLAFGGLMLPVLSIGGVAANHGWEFALSENQEWLRSLATSTDELILAAQNVGLLGVLARNLPGPGLILAKGVWLTVGAGFLLYLWMHRVRSIGWFRDQLLFVIAVFNPLVWSYWILFAFPLSIRAIPGFREQWARSSTAIRIWIVTSIGFVVAAFNGQHARWTWAGGILLALFLVWNSAARERKPS